jgi:hypothetical protein
VASRPWRGAASSSIHLVSTPHAKESPMVVVLADAVIPALAGHWT